METVNSALALSSYGKEVERFSTMPQEEVNFNTYNDLCTECEDHDKCHKNGIDYAKVAKCLTEIEQELARIRCHP